MRKQPTPISRQTVAKVKQIDQTVFAMFLKKIADKLQEKGIKLFDQKTFDPQKDKYGTVVGPAILFITNENKCCVYSSLVGESHGDIRRLILREFKLDLRDNDTEYHIHGFLTTEGYFVGRHTAIKSVMETLGKYEGGIMPKYEHSDQVVSTLYSDNLKPVRYYINCIEKELGLERKPKDDNEQTST